MAFDSKTVGSDPGESFALTRELGHTYLPLDATPPGFIVLDEKRGAALAALADALIPGDRHWPSAADTGAAQYADNSAARSGLQREALIRLADALLAATGAGSPEEAEVAAVAAAVEEEHGALFQLGLELIFEGYYRDGRVQEVVEQRTGYLPTVPVTGMRMDPFDESRLEKVKERPSRVREARS